MAGRIVKFGGVAALGGAAYYLYSAGGDPKLAEKKFERDAAELTRRAKGDFPGQDKEAKKGVEEGYEAVRATAQQYADRAKSEAQKAEEKFDQYSADAKKKYEEARRQAEQQLKDGRKEATAAIDQFDKKVSEGAAQSKSWLGSWFGGK